MTDELLSLTASEEVARSIVSSLMVWSGKTSA